MPHEVEFLDDNTEFNTEDNIPRRRRKSARITALISRALGCSEEEAGFILGLGAVILFGIALLVLIFDIEPDPESLERDLLERNRQSINE